MLALESEGVGATSGGAPSAHGRISFVAGGAYLERVQAIRSAKEANGSGERQLYMRAGAR